MSDTESKKENSGRVRKYPFLCHIRGKFHSTVCADNGANAKIIEINTLSKLNNTGVDLTEKNLPGQEFKTWPHEIRTAIRLNVCVTVPFT